MELPTRGAKILWWVPVGFPWETQNRTCPFLLSRPPEATGPYRVLPEPTECDRSKKTFSRRMNILFTKNLCKNMIVHKNSVKLRELRNTTMCENIVKYKVMPKPDREQEQREIEKDAKTQP